MVANPGVGDVSLWEFSGQECYYGLYDHFIGNTNCIHLVLYSLADPLPVQLEQASKSSKYAFVLCLLHS